MTFDGLSFTLGMLTGEIIACVLLIIVCKFME